MITDSKKYHLVSNENITSAQYSTGLSLVPVSGATDILGITGGNGKTVRIKRLSLSGIAGTAVTADVSLIRRLAPDTAGTFTYLTSNKVDLTDNLVGPTIASISTTTITAPNSYAVGNGVVFSNIGQLTVTPTGAISSISGSTITTAAATYTVGQIVTFSAVANATTAAYVAGPTITSLTSSVFSATNTYVVNQPIVFANIGSMTGITAGTIYYVLTANGTSFTISATPGGSVITPGGTLGTPTLNGISPFWPYYITTTNGTTTFSISATPGGTALSFIGTTVSPTVLNGFAPYTWYYVTAATPTTFSISATSGGSAISFTGSANSATNIVGTASAVLAAYTANPTLSPTQGSGIIRQQKLTLPLTATTVPQIVWQWSDKNDKPLILRGVNDAVYLNLNGATISSGSLDVDITWEEDNS